MLFRHMNIPQQLMPLHDMTVHENNIIVALNVANVLVLWNTNMPKWWSEVRK